MDTKILNIMDTFHLNGDEAQCVGLSQIEVDSGLEDNENSVFVVVYRGGEIYAAGFHIAMSRAWHCISESFKMHSLPDNVFHLIFHSFETRDYVLKGVPWNFSDKILIIHPWNPLPKAPPLVSYSAHFYYCITGLPFWCYTP